MALRAGIHEKISNFSISRLLTVQKVIPDDIDAVVIDEDQV